SFSVRAADIAISLGTETSFTGIVSTGSDLPLSLEILNNTAADKTGLTLVVSKTSPLGEIEEILNQSPDLAAGQVYHHLLTFNESTAGQWEISVQVLESGTSSGGGEEPPAGGPNMFAAYQEGFSEGEGEVPSMTVTASSRMVIRVSEPQVSLEVQAPPFAGNEPFPITLKV
ncbi:MAG: hypothetical protein GY836_22060, partial [Herbaspirillum sp.]|uniref:hypothetical protein n=1 Tax=Herbaspirillum sp. TaxID=1890675 RepID=UPI0025872A34